jgi:CRP-like cAMP-binding protein
MMNKRPQDRYPTWAELALELAEVGKLSVYRRDIADSERFGFLRKSEVFGRLKDAHLWELVHSGRWSRFPPRTAILREEEEGHSLFLLAAGEVKVTKRGRLLDVLKASECFGEMAFVRRNGATREATVEAMTDVLIGEFDPAALSLLTAACRLEIAEGLLRTMVERLALANTRITQVVSAN